MAEHVHFLGAPFHFERIDLTTPNGLQGGSYFTKLTHNSEPLYVQTPKCGTRQGIVISGKKAHYDILLDSASNTPIASERTAFIEWLERVEERVVQLLHEKGTVWFTNELTVEDIRSLFTSPIKSSRGGTQFLIRANIPSSKTNSGQFACSVYDERENQTSIDYVTPDHAVISIIEVTGVRFTSRSFQLELASKQMAVLANKPMFETCIIKKDAPIRELAAVPATAVPTTEPAVSSTSVLTTPEQINLDEVDVFDVNDLQSVHIKSPVEVYYAMYRAAIHRAREAKKIAIESYLDAKNIKNVYNLNLADDDDNDDDDDDNDDDDNDDNDDDDDSDGADGCADFDVSESASEPDDECARVCNETEKAPPEHTNIDNKKIKIAIHDSVSLNISDSIDALLL